MRKECTVLHAKALDSLVLAVDHFNRGWDRGRTEAVLILLDRAFELLLKAAIVHRAGSRAIRDEKKGGITIAFDLCLRKCLSDGNLKCLTEDEVVALQSLNTFRDAAQHYMIELSEEHLYVCAQAALTLFGKITMEVLGRPLAGDLPKRILPVCARPPADLGAMFDVEFADIKGMVSPGSRKRLDAKARLRSMAILQASLEGKKSQPSDGELDRIVKRINSGEGWRQIFPGVATLTIAPEGSGPGLSIRITKREGDAVSIVPEGTPDATIIAVKRVNELDFYSLGLRDLARKLHVSEPKLFWLITNDRMQENADFFKMIRIGRSTHKRYSGKCFEALRAKLMAGGLDESWAKRKQMT
ncbi:MAG: DUF3644 domain-containing protein [Acetobacteraceae bacterium]